MRRPSSSADGFAGGISPPEQRRRRNSASCAKDLSSSGLESLDAEGRIRREGDRLNYGNIGVFHPALFADRPREQAWKLFPWLYGAADAGRVSGELFRGPWHNVGTPEQLAALDAQWRDAD